MASSLYTAGSALGFVCPRYADVPIDTICTFIAFSWISDVLCLRESRTIMVDKATDMVLHRSARSDEHPDFLSEGSITGSKSLCLDSCGDCSPHANARMEKQSLWMYMCTCVCLHTCRPGER